LTKFIVTAVRAHNLLAGKSILVGEMLDRTGVKQWFASTKDTHSGSFPQDKQNAVLARSHVTSDQLSPFRSDRTSNSHSQSISVRLLLSVNGSFARRRRRRCRLESLKLFPLPKSDIVFWMREMQSGAALCLFEYKMKYLKWH
jgi:hypothetical protein